ncbi:hypothetical protein H6G83_15420 [Anabaena azotica FACHB-119]|uniref:Uncharacterized protein n=1 Tax=Anabaena azotica FACHB-119 TaxID=947527 RepID=A0ABR8D6M6_9NOST|nr:hypothetical protein [Anabaena azotica FACHB-119]
MTYSWADIGFWGKSKIAETLILSLNAPNHLPDMGLRLVIIKVVEN